MGLAAAGRAEKKTRLHAGFLSAARTRLKETKWLYFQPWTAFVRWSGSNFHAFSRSGLDDFDFRVARADLLVEPAAGVLLAVAQEHGARRDLPDETDQFAAVGVGGEIEVLHLAASGDFTGTAAEDEGLADRKSVV